MRVAVYNKEADATNGQKVGTDTFTPLRLSRLTLTSPRQVAGEAAVNFGDLASRAANGDTHPKSSSS